MNNGAYYQIEVPRTWKSRRRPPLKIHTISFKACEPTVRDEFKKHRTKFIDVLKLRADGSLSSYGRRYFPDMTSKPI